MKTIMSSIVNHPFICVVILVFLTALFSIPIPGLVIDASNEGMVISGDSEKEYYESVKEIFGDDVLVTVSITSDNIFQEEVLQSIENLSDKINDITLNINGEDVEVVTRVSSLTTVTNIIDRDGDIDTSKLIDYIPSDQEELDEIKKNALRNETFLNDIISRDGKTTTINAYIQSAPPGVITYNHEITNKVRELIGIEKKHLKEQGVYVDIFQISFPFIKVKVTDYIENDIKKLVPICLLVLLIILWVFFRTFTAVLVPAMTAILSIVWTLGIMAFFGYKINTVTSLIPILLIVVGCTEDIHMLSEYKNQLGAGNDKLTAIRNMAVKCGLAIFLTSSTTLLGFSALTINKIVLIREFGICTSIGLVCNFVVTILFIPGFLRWTRVPKSFVSGLNKNNSPLFESIRKFLCNIAIRKRAFTIIGSAIIIIIAIIGTLKVKPDADYVSYFKKDSEVRVKLDMLHSHIAGAKSILIIIDTEQEGGIKDPEIMASIARLQDYLNQRFDKTISIADYVKIMHREMNEGNMGFFKVPDSESLIAQYLLMLEGDELERVLESDYSKACIIARHNIIGSWQENKELKAIIEMSKKLFPKYVNVKITGADVLENKASDYMSKGQVMSLGLAVICIFFIISVLFASLKAGLLAMIPNMLPILLHFGIMGWFNVPLNPSTSIIAVIALGLAVDDTIHLMVRYHNDLKKTNDQVVAMAKTIKNELLPIMSTSLALATGFSILVSSNFVSNIYFGFLAAISIVAALMSDIFVTPGLLLETRLVSSWDMLKLKINKKLIKTSPFFKGLKISEIKKTVLYGIVFEYKDNEYIIIKGDLSRELYLILDGNVDVIIPEKRIIVENMHEGDVFGEMAFITGEERSEDVIAKGNTEVLMINEKCLNNIRLKFPKIGTKIFYNISQILSQRLKRTTIELQKKS